MLQNKCITRLLATVLIILVTPGLNGVVFAAKYKVLHSFGKGRDGGGLFAGMVLDNKNNLYGTTWGGGAYGYGTVFELTPGTGGKWSETILHNFCANFQNCSDGTASLGGVILDAEGNLYGVSTAATFELTPGTEGWTFTKICDCLVPSAIDAEGNLYGIGGPGKHQADAVVELKRPAASSGKWAQKVLYSFCSQRDCRDGEPPEWGLSWDAAGNLYGTTKFGGNYPPICFGSAGCGVAYELEALGGGKWKHQTLHRFAAFEGDGQLPYAGLVADSKGNVYGTTLQGGIGGTVFELSPQRNGYWKETILYEFPNAGRDGGGPSGKLAFDKAGNLYGTAGAGGNSCSCGVVFRLTPRANGKWSYTVLHRFTGQNGWGPGDLIIDDRGNLYGTTAEGGANSFGVAFELTP